MSDSDDVFIYPTWIPPFVEFNECNGWDDYVEKLYAIFKRDFLSDRLFFRNLRIAIRRNPVVENKEGVFWHILGQEDSQRLPVTFERHKRIGWIRPIIVNLEDDLIKVWSHSDFKGAGANRFRICLWFHDEYVVVLEPRDSYVLLVTAFPTDEGHTCRKLQASYDRALARMKAEAAVDRTTTASGAPSAHGR